jgi:hypothetical protein
MLWMALMGTQPLSSSAKIEDAKERYRDVE